MPKQSQVGLRQAYRLTGMSYDDRIDFIAIGLPLILERAQKLYTDSQSLSNSPASEAILINGAKEEAAKILILMDIIRCPKKRIATDIGKLMKWFYSHLARLIYADVNRWKPQDIPQLKAYIRGDRKTHYLDGAIGEYISPNMAIYLRESQLYVDVAVFEANKPQWVSPLHDGFQPHNGKPLALHLAEDFNTLGLLSEKGLRLVADIWDPFDFTGEEAENSRDHWDENGGQRAIGTPQSDKLMRELFKRVQQDGISGPGDIQTAMNRLFRNWQFPLYDFDLSPIVVTQNELEREQELLLAQEMGY